MDRTESIRIRVSKEELARISENPRLVSTNRSSYIRMTAQIPIEYRTDSDAFIAINKEEVRGLRNAINRWGNNYNQGVRALNRIARLLKRDRLSPDFQEAVVADLTEAAQSLKGAWDTLSLNILPAVEKMADMAFIDSPSNMGAPYRGRGAGE
jgi:hypothetical protein